MSDRIQALTVTLTHDIREDDVQRLVQAIEMLSGVQGVSQLWIANIDAHVARQRIKGEFFDALVKTLNAESRQP